MLDKNIKRKLSFHRFINNEKPITIKEYKTVLLFKNLFISTIAIAILFWILIIISLATPNYDVVKDDSLYLNMTIKYRIYIAIFFFLSLSLWFVNAVIYIFGTIYINKLHCEMSNELLWSSIVNIFFSVALVFVIIGLVNSIKFLKKNANVLV